MDTEKKQRLPQASGGLAGGAYGLAFIGALIYFIQEAAGFGDVLVGILKAILWPAFLTYELLKFLGT